VPTFSGVNHMQNTMVVLSCIALGAGLAYPFTGSCDKAVRQDYSSDRRPKSRQCTAPPSAISLRIGPPSFHVPSQINQVAFSPGGQLLAAGGADGIVRIWDVNTARLIDRLPTWDSKPVTALTFSPTGSVLAYATHVGKFFAIHANDFQPVVHIWDCQTRKYLHDLGSHKDTILALSFSPDGRLLATAGRDSAIKLWNVRTGKIVHSWVCASAHAIAGLTFSRNGQQLAARASDRVFFWQVDSGELLATDAITLDWRSSWISRDGDLQVLLYRCGSSVQLRDIRQSGRRYASANHGAIVTSASFSPDGKTFASAGTDNRVILWRTSTCKPIGTLSDVAERFSSMAFCPNAPLIACASDNGVISVWNLNSKSQLHPWGGNQARLTAVCFDTCAGRIATGSTDGTICTWDVESGKLLRRFHRSQSPIEYVAFPYKGESIISAALDNSIECWNGGSGKISWVAMGPGSGLRCVRLISDSDLLITGEHCGAVRLWNKKAGMEILRLDLPQAMEPINSVCLSGDSKTAVAGGESGTVYVWNVESKKIIATLRGHTRGVTQVVCSYDGELVISASARGDGSVRIWKVPTGQTIHTCRGHIGGVLALALSPDGRLVASGGEDSSMCVWEVVSGKRMRILNGHESAVTCLAFSPDGRKLVSGSDDFSAIVWDLTQLEQSGDGKRSLSN
jgi:WD40 repeat protein